MVRTIGQAEKEEEIIVLLRKQGYNLIIGPQSAVVKGDKPVEDFNKLIKELQKVIGDVCAYFGFDLTILVPSLGSGKNPFFELANVIPGNGKRGIAQVMDVAIFRPKQQKLVQKGRVMEYS